MTAIMTKAEKEAAKKKSKIIYVSYGLSAVQHLLAKNSAISQIAKYANMFLKAMALVKLVQKIRNKVNDQVKNGKMLDTMNPQGTAVTKSLNTATTAEKKSMMAVVKEWSAKVNAAIRKARSYSIPSFPKG